MKSRLTTLLTAVGLSMTLGIAGAPAAQAADVPCTITNFSPRTVVVGLTPIVRTFGISTTGCTLRDWIATSNSFSAYPEAPQETFIGWSNSEAGSHDVVVDAYNGDWDVSSTVFSDGFKLLRRTTWQTNSFNASPEPAKRGSTITITGRLLLVDWTQERYVPYAARSVALEFRTPTGAYTHVKVVKTDANGWVRTTVPASSTGVWRLRYGGNTIAGSAVTLGDSVQVNG
jgi:hypothetical protein